MKNTISITTFNILNNPDLKEERVEALLEELDAHGSDVALLQEVLEETFPILKNAAERKGWYVSEGTRTVSSPVKTSGNVTLSRIPITSQFNLNSPLCSDIISVETLITHLEGGVTVINAHLPWGQLNEVKRLDTLYCINQYAERLQDQEPDTLIIVGGDFNATLESSAVRYLHGEHPYKDTSTFWTTAWHFTNEIFSTARRDGGWAENTARNMGITRPELLPDRTIDHILTFGWNYGKRRSPVTMQKFGESVLSNGYGLSDHYGITTKIAL